MRCGFLSVVFLKSAIWGVVFVVFYSHPKNFGPAGLISGYPCPFPPLLAFPAQFLAFYDIQYVKYRKTWLYPPLLLAILQTRAGERTWISDYIRPVPSLEWQSVYWEPQKQSNLVLFCKKQGSGPDSGNGSPQKRFGLSCEFKDGSISAGA